MKEITYENLPSRCEKKKLTINKVYNQTLYKLIIDIKRELQPYVSAEIVIKHMMMLDKRERKNTL